MKIRPTQKPQFSLTQETSAAAQPDDRRKSSVKQFGSLEVHTKQFKPREAYRMLARLLEMSGGTGSVTDISIGDLDGIMVDMLKLTWCVAPDGAGGAAVKYELSNPDKIDDAFSGRLKTMSDVFSWVVSENFNDFLADSSAAKSESSETETPE